MHDPMIDRLIDGWKQEIIDTLKTWIAVPSVRDDATACEGAPFGTATRDMLDLAMNTARRMGMEAEAFDGYCGHVMLGDGERLMGILAHLDVVPAGDGWTKPPFGGVEENGRLYGRGTNDDKGPALAALYAMRAIKEAGVPLKDGVRLVLGCCEETGSADMETYKARCRVPDYGFSPDAEYPVINTEKGGMGLVLEADSGREEEGRIPVYSLQAGERSNVVPGLAYAEVGTKNVPVEAIRKELDALNAMLSGEAQRPEKSCLSDDTWKKQNEVICEKRAAGMTMRLSVEDRGEGRARICAEGQGAHASTPDLGVNAAGLLILALAHMGAGGGIRNALIDLADKLGLEAYGKSLGTAADDPMCGPLTCNLGLLRYDGEKLSVTLDNRYPLSTNMDKIYEDACAAAAGTALTVKNGGGRTVYHVPEDSEIVQGLLKAYHEASGLPAYVIAIGGGTYSRTMPNTVAFGSNFPDEVECAHMPDESIDLEKYMLTVKIMARAIEVLAAKQD